MANRFVRSGATGTGTGADWTNAYTTLTLAIAGSAAGDTYFVADDHAETTASALSLTFKGTLTSPDIIACVDHTIASPGSADLKTTGSVTTTGNSALSLLGSFYCYGLVWNCGSGANAPNFSLGATSNSSQVYRGCTFSVLGTTGASAILTGNVVFASVKWFNCTTTFGAVGQTIKPAGGFFEWMDTATPITGATIPTNLITPTTIAFAKAEGVDFSAIPSGKNLFLLTGSTTMFVVKECKLGSAAGTTGGTVPNMGSRIDLIRCDSANTNYRNESYQRNGTQTTETTIVRSGGATDGVTGFSQKIVTTANSRWQTPFENLPLTIWNDAVGSSMTITVEAIASAVPNNDEVWMAVEYMGDASFPTGSRLSTGKADVLATGAANTTSTATWGGALTGKFKMAVTITPQQKGPITAYVRVAKASTTVYIDPLITIT